MENKKLFFVSLTLILFLMLTMFFLNSPNMSLFTGNIILDDATYSRYGFASPRDSFSNDVVFTITPDNFVLSADNQQINMNVEVNQPGGYIYKTGYYYSDNAWTPFEFSQNTVGTSNWINDRASQSLSINANGALVNGEENFIVTYSCKKYYHNMADDSWTANVECSTRTDANCQWKCGCSANKTICNQWMLHSFNIEGVQNQSIRTVTCTLDSDCGINEKCMSGSCIAKIAGLGTPADPFRIYDISDLQDISKNVGASYTLETDIDASSTKNLNNGLGWTPIQNFNGKLLGNGHVIKNLYINNSAIGNAGLFGSISDAEIRDLGLEEVSITVGGNDVGALAGSVSGISVISKVYSTGNVKGNSQVGGLIGSFNPPAVSKISLSRLYSGANVWGARSGGVLGFGNEISGDYPLYTITFTDLYATGNVTGYG